MRIPLIAGNWKMYKTVADTVKYVKELRGLVKDVGGVEIVIAPPFTAVHAAAEAARNSNVGIAAQDLYWERDGAYTGAGTVLRRNVPPGALAVSGGPQRNLEGWVVSRRAGTAAAQAAEAAIAKQNDEKTEEGR